MFWQQFYEIFLWLSNSDSNIDNSNSVGSNSDSSNSDSCNSDSSDRDSSLFSKKLWK